MTSRNVTVNMSGDVEARPAHLVQVASRYESSIYIECDDKKVNAKSIIGMMGLVSMGLVKGCSVLVTATGSDEEVALDNVEKFLTGTV